MLHKVLPVGFLPVGLTLIVLSVGAISRRWNYVRIAIGGLWILSTPLFATLATAWMERGLERQSAEAMPRADAIVVLSEGRTIAPGAAQISEWVDADRFFGGVDLFEAGKSQLLVFTNGEGRLISRHHTAEGDVLSAFARRLGVPDSSIAVTGPVANTAEEAQRAWDVLKVRGLRSQNPSVLLVTSAMHMSRAQRLFAQVGFRVTPFPVDFKARGNPEWLVLRILPSASALAQTEAAFREALGRWWYALSR